MLASRLAMQCKGTAWAQVKEVDPTALTDPVSGAKVLLQALSSWDEAAELQTYEKFEKALFRVQQRQDETTMSYVKRLAVAAKKKVYPVNFMEDDTEEVHTAEDDGFDEEQYLQQLADQGDEDANFVADYEDQIVDMVQELPPS